MSNPMTLGEYIEAVLADAPELNDDKRAALEAIFAGDAK